MTSAFQLRKEKIKASFTNFKANGGIKGVIQNHQHQQQQQLKTNQGSPLSVLDHDPSGYSLGDHMEYLHMHPHNASGCNNSDNSSSSSSSYYYSDVGHLLCDSLIPGLIKDYCVPLTDSEWEVRCHGLENASTSSSTNPPLSQLPIRTLTIRLAPDVMTSTVIDAIHDACRDTFVTHQVLKRFQGHFQCLLVPEDENEVPFVMDIRVCTNRTGVLERCLLLRIYYADSLHNPKDENDDHNNGVINKDDDPNAPPSSPLFPKTKPRSVEQSRAQILQSLQDSTIMMVPMNLHLRSACAFLQYLGQQQRSFFQNPSGIPAPQPSPKASTSFFLGNFQPTLSVQQWNDTTPEQYRFPSLNSQDWSLLQSTWTMVSSIWRNLMMHNCLFHTYELANPGSTGGKVLVAPVVLDMHYCSQIREIARDTMLKDLESSLENLQMSLEKMEATYQGFTLVLQKALLGYQMAKHDTSHSKTPTLARPSRIPPIGYLQLAEMVAKCVTVDPRKTPAQVCDETIIKTYKTFGSQDDKESRKYIKEANATIVKRMVQLQEIQRQAIRALELDANTQQVSRAFSSQARQATNTLGRVDRFLLARVPLLDMELVGNGRCQITASNMLCWWERFLSLGGGGGGSNHNNSNDSNGGSNHSNGNNNNNNNSNNQAPSNVHLDKRSVILVDLRAVQFQVLNDNCVSVSDKKSKASICKLFTTTTADMTKFIALIQCLQQQHQDDLVNLLGSLHYPVQFPNSIPPPPPPPPPKKIDHRGIHTLTDL